MTQISNKEIIFEGKSIYYFLENIDIKSKLIENEFFENYYLENFTSYLEYPEEVLYKISSLEILDQPDGKEQVIDFIHSFVLSKQSFVDQCWDGRFDGVG